MPGDDGHELIRRVRALTAEAGGEVPAVALTAYAWIEGRMRTLRACHQMHIAKSGELAGRATAVSSLLIRGEHGSVRQPS